MSISKDDITRVDNAELGEELRFVEAAKGARIHDRLEGREATLEEDVNPLRRSFLRLYGCLFVAYLCAATNGYDANTFGASA